MRKERHILYPASLFTLTSRKKAKEKKQRPTQRERGTVGEERSEKGIGFEKMVWAFRKKIEEKKEVSLESRRGGSKAPTPG